MVGSVVKGQGRIFTVQGFLGKGAMGMVYRVTDVAGQELALKEIRPLTSTAVMDPELLFQNEVQSMAILKRFPEIVKIKGSFNDGHARFVVMEFLKGQTLEDLLLKGALPNKQAWQILLQLVQAVAPIQQLAVLRDLKASNVMIVQNQVRLFDLGFVHMLNSGSFRFPSGLVLGTPGYGSPEQFGRHVLSDFSQQVRQSDPSFYWRINLPDPYPDVLPAFDVHALGAIGYYLMTGHDPSQALYNWNWSNVDYRVRGVLHRATDLNLRNRYRDATEMLQAMVSMGGVY